MQGLIVVTLAKGLCLSPSHRLTNKQKKSSARRGYEFPWLLFRGCPEDTKMMKDIAIAFGCPQEVDSKMLLLKKKKNTYSITGHGDTKPIITKKLPSCWEAFIVVDVLCRLLSKKNSLQ